MLNQFNRLFCYRSNPLMR